MNTYSDQVFANDVALEEWETRRAALYGDLNDAKREEAEARLVLQQMTEVKASLAYDISAANQAIARLTAERERFVRSLAA